jgi:hypothetical protein
MTSSKRIDMSDIFVPSTAPMLIWPEVTASPIAALEGPDGPMTSLWTRASVGSQAVAICDVSKSASGSTGWTWTQPRSAAPSLTRACYPGLIPLADASSLPALYRPARAAPKAGIRRKHRPPQEKYFHSSSNTQHDSLNAKIEILITRPTPEIMHRPLRRPGSYI